MYRHNEESRVATASAVQTEWDFFGHPRPKLAGALARFQALILGMCFFDNSHFGSWFLAGAVTFCLLMCTRIRRYTSNV